MHYKLDATTLIRQRAAETARIVAHHHQSRRLDRVGSSRSGVRRVFDQLRRD